MAGLRRSQYNMSESNESGGSGCFLGIICVVLAAFFGFAGLFAYGFWSAGSNPTAKKHLTIATVLGIIGVVLLVNGSKSKPEK